MRALPLVFVCLVACAARRPLYNTPGCVPVERAPDLARLIVGRPLRVATACPPRPEGALRGPLTLTATPDGLRVEFAVAVESFSPGPYRDDSPERDAVVVFPLGEGPGRAAVELPMLQIEGGYRVEEILPWDTWALDGPRGRFTLALAVFDRQASGAEHESRIALHIIVGEEDHATVAASIPSGLHTTPRAVLPDAGAPAPVPETAPAPAP